MATALIVARVGLAAIFLVAAIAKLADMPGSRAALAGFEVRASLVPTLSVALPAAEIGAAALLLIAPTARVGATLGVILFVVFIAAIAAALRRGASPDCHCFGQLHSRPAGSETIARNAVLAAVGVFVLAAGPGPAVDAWARTQSAAVVALAATSLLAFGLAGACVSLWLENRRLSGSGARAPVPVPLEPGQLTRRFEAIDRDGVPVASADLLVPGVRSVLVFTSATCGPCIGLLPELARWRKILAARLSIHVLASGDAAANRRLADEHDVPVLLDHDGSAAQAFGVSATPSAFLIDEAGRVEAPVAMGTPSIEGLIRAALKRPSGPIGLDIRHVGGAAAGTRIPS
jgi:hypothetical protein